MKFIVKRKGATPRPVDDKSFIPDILAICEFVTPGRTPAPMPISAGSLRLRVGAIYKLVTGLAVEGVERPWQVYAAALGPLWKEGLEITRVDVQPEIVFYVKAIGEVTIHIGQGAVAMEVIDRAGYSLSQATVESQVAQAAAPLPPLGFVAQTGGERFVKGVSGEAGGQANLPGKQLTETEIARQGDAWLNEDDGKGKVGGADSTTSVNASIGGAIEAAPPANGGMPSIVAMTNKDAANV